MGQAIAELVDNSIDAQKEGKLLTIKIILNPRKELIEITDDGMGMDEETAINSIRLAYSDKKNKLGEFGLGLKTAATSLGKKFQIITTKSGSDEEYMLEYDEDKWLKNGDWTNHEIKIKKGIDKKRSGTIIKIQNLRCSIYPNLPGNIRKDLSVRFAPYLENKEVRIMVNTKWCEPEPLDLKIDYYPPNGKEPFDFEVESGNRVWGWRGLLKKGSDKGEYGFRVFRRGRLISQFAKMGFNPHPEARQITGELHFDHVPVTHNKREFIEESPLYQEIIREDGIFWTFMRDLVREARSSMRKTQINQGILDKMEIQKENVMKAIKKIPELKEYAFPDLKEKIKGSKDDNEGLTEMEVEKRDPREVVTFTVESESPHKKGRKPQKIHTRKTYYITINGKKFKMSHSFVDLKTEEVLRDKTIDDKEGIHVYTNIAFPAFANTKDHIFYGVWNIAESIAEIMVEQNKKPAGEVIEIRDLILKKTAEIGRELDEVEKEKKMAERLKKEYDEKVAKIRELETKQLENK
ncbi:MAG: ATP-binding protein [Atribacterota bacterium]|nr:ATP-binding protein [Atribacterota bacterium]